MYIYIYIYIYICINMYKDSPTSHSLSYQLPMLLPCQQKAAPGGQNVFGGLRLVNTIAAGTRPISLPCPREYIYVYMYVYICMYMYNIYVCCMYVCIHTYIYI